MAGLQQAKEQTSCIPLSLGSENGKLYFSEMILQHFYLNFFLGDRGDVLEGKGTNFYASMKI